MITDEQTLEGDPTTPRPLVIEPRTDGAVTVLRLSGDLDHRNMEQARHAVGELFRAHEGDSGFVPQFVMDMDDIDFVDSSGLGFLLGTLKKAREAGGDLKLAQMNAYLLGIFKLINLHYIIDCHESVEKAVSGFRTS